MVAITRRALLGGAAAASLVSLDTNEAKPDFILNPYRFATGDTWLSATLGTTPILQAANAFARNLTTGQNLLEKAPDTQTAGNAAASTTKMATAILVAREMALGAITMSTTATVLSGETPPTILGTVMGLQVGDVITFQDLLYGLFLPSGGDAAYVMARVVGTAIHDRAGSGTTGSTRFIEAMNALATELSMTQTVYTAPDGYQVSGNKTSARDLARLLNKCLQDSTTQALTTPSLQTFASTYQYLVTITGANARTFTITNTSQLVGPDRDVGFVACKTGSSGVYSVAYLWEAPTGDRIALIIVASDTSGNRYADLYGLRNEMLLQFQTLCGTIPTTDADFSSVVFLAGADAGYVDESSYGRTLTNTSATTTSTGAIGSAAYATNGSTGHIDAADAAELSMAASDFTVEFWFRGTGTGPTDFAAMVSKWDSAANQREYNVQYDNSATSFVFFLSSNGSNNFSTVYTAASSYAATKAAYFNGSLHHIRAQVLSGLATIYIDGLKGGSGVSAGSLFNGTAKLVLGAKQSGAGILFPTPLGMLDEVRISKVARTAAVNRFLPLPIRLPRTA